MFNFISIIKAEDAVRSSSGSAIFMQLIPFLLIFVIFYFLLIRPQRKKQTQHKAMISQLKAGDVVVLGSGFKGTIVKLAGDEFVSVEIAQNTVVDVLRSSVLNVIK